MISFIVWWVLGFLGSMVGLTKMAHDGYFEAGDSMGWVSTAGGIGLWLIVVQIYPWRRCPGRCKGTGKLGEPLSTGFYWRETCSTCGGRGKVFRWWVLPSHPLKVAAREQR